MRTCSTRCKRIGDWIASWWFCSRFIEPDDAMPTHTHWPPTAQLSYLISETKYECMTKHGRRIKICVKTNIGLGTTSDQIKIKEKKNDWLNKGCALCCVCIASERKNEIMKWKIKEIECATPFVAFNLSPESQDPQLTKHTLHATHKNYYYLFSFFSLHFSVAAQEIWHSFKINKLFPVRWIYFENDNFFLLVALTPNAFVNGRSSATCALCVRMDFDFMSV